MKRIVLKSLAIIALTISVIIFPIIVVLLEEDHIKFITGSEKKSILELLYTLIYNNEKIKR